MDDVTRLRLQIMDRRRAVLNEVSGQGDGVTAAFRFNFAPVFDGSESITVKTGDLLEAIPREGYSVDYETGVFRLNLPPANGAGVITSYTWAVFSDPELEALLEEHKTVRRSAVAALEILLADTDRFLKYTEGTESADRTKAADVLKDLLEKLRAQGGPVGLVMADTPCRVQLLDPFHEGNACG